MVVDEHDADAHRSSSGELGHGTSATSVVPAPGDDSTVSRPPTSSTRSRMPTNPSAPARAAPGSNP